MDEACFDDLIRSFTAERTRRGAARLLAGGLLGGILNRSRRAAAAVACTPETVATDCPRPVNPCKKPKCIEGTCRNVNRVDGANCPGGTCTAGTCICKDGFKDCDGAVRTGCEVNTDTDPANCGACDNQCPGLGRPNVRVTCSGGLCTRACRGDFYDVDNDLATGCEVEDDEVGHILATARNLGSKGCKDGDSRTIFSGRIVSDARAHVPEPEGFSRATGSAPDLWKVVATGTGGASCAGQVNNDLEATITTSGGSSVGDCYRLSILNINGAETHFVNVSGNNAAGRTVRRSYRDGDTFYFKIAKTCGTGVRENVRYRVDFHL